MFSSAGFRDGLGERDLHFDREAGQIRERLTLRPELAAYESVLRRRIGRLASMADPRLVPLDGIEHDAATGRLVVAYRHVSGLRLGDLLRAAREREIIPDFTVGLFVAAEILAAAHTLHALSNLPHGALTPDRVVVTADGEVLLTDFAFSEVIEAASFSASRLWREFGLAVWLGNPFTVTGDVRQAAVTAIAMLLGRPASDLDLPAGLEGLLLEVEEAAAIQGGRLFSDPVIDWFRRALGSEDMEGFAHAAEAAEACAALLTERERSAARPALVQFLLELTGGEAAGAAEPEPEPERVRVVSTPALAFEPQVIVDLTEDPGLGGGRESPAAAPEAPSDGWTEVDLDMPGETAPPAAARGQEPVANPEPEPEPVAPVPEPVYAQAGASAVWQPSAPVLEPHRGAPSLVSSDSPFATLQSRPVPEVRTAASAVALTGLPVPPPRDAGPAASPAAFASPAIPAGYVPPPPAPAAIPPAAPPTPAFAAPASAPIRLAEPTGPKPDAPIRLKESKQASRAIQLNLDDRSDREDAEQEQSSGFRMPWKLAAAAVLLIAGVTAGTLGWPSSSAREVVPVAPGVLVIETTPPGSEIFIDGAPKGVTPATIQVDPGTHELKLSRKGASHAWSVDVAAGARRVERLDWTALRQTGGIEVVTNNPGARVLVDGTARGETPLVISDLKPGRHVVIVEGPNGRVRRTVRVVGGETTKLDLAIYSGWLIVSAPIELQVVEQGKVLGSAGEAPLVLGAGAHTVEFVNDALGYRESRGITIEPGEELRIAVEPRGKVNINAVPWAEVWLEGAKLGETPLANVSVPLGTRELVFKHPEHGERRLSITVTASDVQQVSVDLTRP